MARATSGFLLAQMTGRDTPSSEILFEPELIVRDSTGPALAGAPEGTAPSSAQAAGNQKTRAACLPRARLGVPNRAGRIHEPSRQDLDRRPSEEPLPVRGLVIEDYRPGQTGARSRRPRASIVTRRDSPVASNLRGEKRRRRVTERDGPGGPRMRHWYLVNPRKLDLASYGHSPSI